MPHFVPEKFSNSTSIVNKLAYQAKSVSLSPIEQASLGKMVSNLESPVEGTETLEDILRHKREEEAILRAHLERIVFRDAEE